MGMNVLLAGFSCIDIIKSSVSNNKISIGGTAANVASFLSFISGKQVSIIIPKMNNNFLKKELCKRRIDVIEIGSRPSNCPIIIENISYEKHTFISVCPFCNYKIRNIKLPSHSDFLNNRSRMEFPLFFFYDRISPGIKSIVNSNAHGWNFYEPNSLRSYTSFIDNAKSADIIKFSSDRISERQTNSIINDLQNSKVKMIIITLGTGGLKYSVRGKNGLCNWIIIDSIKCVNTIDSSGAGDWLSSVLINDLIDYYPQGSTLIEPKTICPTLLKAQRIASKSCEYLGAHGICESREGVDYINHVLKTNSHKQNVFTNGSLRCPNCNKLIK